MEAFASNWLASCSRPPSMLSRMSAITSAATNRIEFTGVPRRASRRVNQSGVRWSHPAVMGKRVNPVKIRLAVAMARASIANGPAQAPTPVLPKAARMVCGIGPITLIGSPPTNASTELVPRMNIRQITGAEIVTDCPDGARGAAALACQDRYIFKPAQRAHRHLAKDRLAEPAGPRRRPWNRFVARRGPHRRPQRQRQQDRVSQHDQHAARIVQPLAD